MNSLTTSYLLDMVDIDKFANANGIINIARGIGCLIGPFFAGNFNYSFNPCNDKLI